MSDKDTLQALLEMNRRGLIYWGARAIAKRIGRTVRQVYHLLAKRKLKGARKIGSTWVITEPAIKANFEPETV